VETVIWVNVTDLCRPACSVAVTVIEGTTWAAWSLLLSDVPKPLGDASTAWRTTRQSRPGNWMLLKLWRKSTRRCGRRTGMLEVPSMYVMTFYFLWIVMQCRLSVLFCTYCSDVHCWVKKVRFVFCSFNILTSQHLELILSCRTWVVHSIGGLKFIVEYFSKILTGIDYPICVMLMYVALVLIGSLKVQQVSPLIIHSKEVTHMSIKLIFFLQ